MTVNSLKSAAFAAAALTALSLAALPLAATAQESGRPASEGWSIDVGGGVLASPTYLGDDATQVSALPYVRATYGERLYASVQEGLGYRLVNAGGWRVGPVLSIEFGRDEEEGGNPFRIGGDDTTDLIGLGDIDTSFALGGFVERDLGPFTASLAVRQALGGHEGLVGDAGVSYRARLGAGRAPTLVSAGPRARFGDETYAQALFGVDAIQAVGSGLAQYEAGSGLVSYGVGASLVRPLSTSLTLVAIAGLDTLTGDAADSPLVMERGEERQASAGVFLTYRLN